MKQPPCKFRFLLGLRNIHINEPLGKGDKILDQFLITNDKRVIEGFLSPELLNAIGGLEFQALLDADGLIYSEGEMEMTPNVEKSVDFLTQLIHWSGVFLNALWMVRDNAVGFELGFLEIRPTGGVFRTHSNFMAAISEMADGTRPVATFTRHEVREARKLFHEVFVPLALATTDEIIAPSPSFFKSPTLTAKPGVPRLKRAFYFLQDARSNRDLGMKIAMYCSLFESLFSTDASEITHKIAHRIAIFLEDEPQVRCELYAQVKKAYGIRSKVVHGDSLGKDTTDQKVQAIAVQTDEIARRILSKISNSKSLTDLFHTKKDSLEEYFLKASFGYRDGPSVTA